MKRICSVALIIVTLFALTSCGLIWNSADMPFNGEVEFHDITVTVPNDFIRDSTQSSDKIWMFEKSGYKQLILIIRSEMTADIDTTLDSYVDYMLTVNAESERTEFIGLPAVRSTYTKDGTTTQEMLFAYGNYTYAVALRGGSAEDYNSLLNSVKIIESAEK